MPDATSVALILPAAGTGCRLGSIRPKALVEIHGRPLLCHALERFVAVRNIVEVVVPVVSAEIEFFERAVAEPRLAPLKLRVVAGGSTRQESVALGLAALESSPTLVCVHDAARPLVSPQTIERVIRAAKAGGAATAASRPADSIRQDLPGSGSQALDRDQIWLVETPQAFVLELLRRAHAVAASRGLHESDDAALVEAMCGAEVAVVASSAANPKVTTPIDLALVTTLLAELDAPWSCGRP